MQMRAINAAAQDIQTSWLPSVRWVGEMRVQSARYRAVLRDHLIVADSERADVDKNLAARKADFEKAATGLPAADLVAGRARTCGSTGQAVAELCQRVGRSAVARRQRRYRGGQGNQRQEGGAGRPRDGRDAGENRRNQRQGRGSGGTGCSSDLFERPLSDGRHSLRRDRARPWRGDLCGQRHPPRHRLDPEADGAIDRRRTCPPRFRTRARPPRSAVSPARCKSSSRR